MTAGNSKNEAIAAFIVVFFLLISYAGAAQYDSCPTSTKVEDGWWDSVNCEGGILEDGSLYFKWADAPFTNESVEVQSAKLSISGISEGTDLLAYVWTGSRWYSLYTETIDFRGDYIFDIPYLPGAYVDGSMRIKVVNRGEETLHIDELRAIVEYGSRMRELSVLVRDCDTKKRLEDVEVEADGNSVDTGDDGVALFSLPKDEYYTVNIGGDDYSGVRKRVYLRDDHELEVCVRRIDRHEVDVRDLDVEKGVITFEIENTGNVKNDLIRYSVMINGKSIFEGSTELDPGEDDEIVGSYGFGPGKHGIKARAVAGSYADSDYVTYCVEGVTDNYVCSGNKLLRETIKPGCVSYWEQVGDCEGEVPEEEADGTCGVQIVSVDYLDGVTAEAVEKMSAKVKNTGEGTRDVSLKLYVNGRYMDIEKVSVKEGETESASFSFMMDKGLNEFRIDAIACGSVKDSTQGKIEVFGEPLSPGVPEGPDVEEAPEPDPIERIFIETDKTRIEMEEFGSESIKVNLYPPTEEYTISVTGIDREWIDYDKTVDSVKDGTLYIYISPREAGNYTLRIRAWLGEEPGDVYDEETVKLTVTARKPYAHEEGEDAKTEPPEEGDAITGLAGAVHSPWLGLAIAGSVMAAILMLLFARMYMIDHHNPQHGIMNYESQQVRRAAIEGENELYGGSGSIPSDWESYW